MDGKLSDRDIPKELDVLQGDIRGESKYPFAFM
jgi:hypothetical protein